MKGLEAGFEATRGSRVRIMVRRVQEMLEKDAQGRGVWKGDTLNVNGAMNVILTL